MADKHLIIAMDTGGSKTHMALATANGETIAETVCDGFGLAVDDVNMPLPGLADAVTGFLSENQRKKVANIVANLGGKNENQLKDALETWFPNAKVAVYRESSGFLAEAVAARAGANAALLCGTGVICVANGPRGRFIADGWGAEIGDEGSGYWIGMQVIRRTLKALEGEAPLEMLARYVAKRDLPIIPGDAMEIMRVRDRVRAQIFPLTRARVAAYTRVCAQCAKEGDREAMRIFADAGALMAETLLRAFTRVGLSGGRVVAMGGLTNCVSYWREGFQNRAGRNIELVPEGGDLMSGAMSQAVLQAKKG